MFRAGCDPWVALGSSGVVVGEAGGELAVSVGLGEERVGLGLEEFDGVGTGGEPRGGLLKRGEVDERGGELRRVAALLAVHALPRLDGRGGAVGVVGDG